MKDLAEEYVHFSGALDCLERARTYLLEVAGNEGNPVLRAAAYRMALVEYAKPYTQSRGAVSRYVLKAPLLSDSDQQLHNSIIMLRNKVLAHHDLTVLDAKVSRIVRDTHESVVIISNRDFGTPSPAEVIGLIERSLDQLFPAFVALQKTLPPGPCDTSCPTG